MRCSGFTSIRTILAFGLCLSVSIPTAFGQSSPDTDEATDAMFTIPTMEERQTVFGPIDDAFRAGQKAKVADLLVEVVDNPIHTSFHAESYARLGAVLDELSLPYSALISYQKALKTDATAVSSVAKDAIRLADQVGDTALLESVFAANVVAPGEATQPTSASATSL